MSASRQGQACWMIRIDRPHDYGRCVLASVAIRSMEDVVH